MPGPPLLRVVFVASHVLVDTFLVHDSGLQRYQNSRIKKKKTLKLYDYIIIPRLCDNAEVSLHPKEGYPAGGYPAGGYPVREYPIRGCPIRSYPIVGYHIEERRLSHRRLSYKRGSHTRVFHRRQEGVQ